MKTEIRRYAIWTVIVSAVATGLVWSFWPRAVPVEIAEVTHGSMQVDVSDEGRTRVRESYQVSAPVGGKLLRIEKHAGDAVKAGQVVAVLLPTPPTFLDVRSRTQAEAAVKSAEAARNLAAAELERAKAELAFAISDLRRVTALAQEQAASQSELERAQLGVSTKTAEQATAQAALRAKDYDLQTAKALLIDPNNAATAQRAGNSIPLTAPVDGKVLRVLRENESVIPAGTPILEIGNPAQIEIVVDLVSTDAVKVKPGADAMITDWGGDKPLQARVRRIEPSGFTKVSALGIEEQRVNVLLDFTGSITDWGAIADGYSVVAHITIWQASDVVQVPVQAIFRRGDGWAVFAVRDGRAVLTPVAIGQINDRTAQVMDGLVAGERVIAHPSDRIEDGIPVTEEEIS